MVTMDHEEFVALDGSTSQTIAWSQTATPTGKADNLTYVNFRFNDIASFRTEEYVPFDYLWLLGAVGGVISLFRIIETLARKVDVIVQENSDTAVGPEGVEGVGPGDNSNGNGNSSVNGNSSSSTRITMAGGTGPRDTDRPLPPPALLRRGETWGSDIQQPVPGNPTGSQYEEDIRGIENA